MTKKILLIILPVFIILAGFYFLFRVKPVDVKVFRINKGEVESTVTATTTGTVQARALSKISSQYTGRIKRILKRDGERVKKVRPCLRLKTTMQMPS